MAPSTSRSATTSPDPPQRQRPRRLRAALVSATVLLAAFGGALALAERTPDAAPPGRDEGGSAAVPATAEAVPVPVPVPVPVGADLQELVDAHPAGTSFLLAPGTHREQSVEPKDRMVFVGSPGAVLSGARVLREFAQEEGTWYAANQEQEGRTQGECDDEQPLCDRPDTVLLDGRPAERVGSRAALAPGSYWFDYDADRIWFGSDPRSQTVEAAVTPQAFDGEAAEVVVRSLVVEKYATPAQDGAVDASDGRSWTIEDVTARLNHGGGLRAGEGTRILGSRAVDNGQIGITGTGAGILVADTEIARNGGAGFAAGWEAGGTKFSLTTGLTVRDCEVHGNDGPGLWTDVDNVRTRYEGNSVHGNAGEGIFHEISGTALIRDNVVRGNGTGFSEWVFGAGIHVASSRGVEVVGNLVEDNANGIVGSQQARGDGPYGPRLLKDLYVHDNTVRSSGTVGVAQDVGDRTVFTERGIRFEDNRYRKGQHFVWDDRELGAREWRALGHDSRGHWTD